MLLSQIKRTSSTYFQGAGRVEATPVYLLDELNVGDRLKGPAMVIDKTQTIVVVRRLVLETNPLRELTILSSTSDPVRDRPLHVRLSRHYSRLIYGNIVR